MVGARVSRARPAPRTRSDCRTSRAGGGPPGTSAPTTGPSHVPAVVLGMNGISRRSQRPSPHHQAPSRRALRASSRSRSGCATTRARDLFGAGPDPPRLHAGRHRHAPRVGRALAFIREKACEGITAADVAAVMLGSRRLAEMDFKKATGHAIQQEILHVRFERVELLLRRRA